MTTIANGSFAVTAADRQSASRRTNNRCSRPSGMVIRQVYSGRLEAFPLKCLIPDDTICPISPRHDKFPPVARFTRWHRCSRRQVRAGVSYLHGIRSDRGSSVNERERRAPGLKRRRAISGTATFSTYHTDDRSWPSAG